jgi:autotransporter-associated beta strand protein
MNHRTNHSGTEAARPARGRQTAFRTLAVLCGILGLAGVQSARAITNSLPFYEPFHYTNEMEELGQFASGTNWSFGNSVTGSSGRLTTNATLNYLGLITDPNSEGLAARTSGAGSKNRGAPFTAQTSGSVYFSFLFSVNATIAQTYAFLGLGNLAAGSSTAGAGATVWVDSLGRLLVSKNNSATAPTTPATMPLTFSNTYLVVVRYTFNSGTTSDDQVDLWLNPLPFGDNNNVPASNFSTTTGTDATILQSLGYYQIQQAGGVPNISIDEIRVGKDWASVTPKSCSPGQLFNVTGGGAQCGGGQFNVGLTGSEAGVDYWLLTNGVYSMTVAGTGLPLDFGLQSETALYNVVGSNTTTGCVGWMNGNAKVSILSPPAITIPPVSQSPVAGSIVSLFVAATGDGLTYQWQRNGTNISDGGEFSGTTNAILFINPVGAADATTGTSDGYDVVVSGSCSPPAVSARVSLILKSASNLIWSGNGTSNPWDIAVTSDWLNGGTPAVFNSGDNVTFDDTSGNTTVNLTNVFLNPHSVTVSALNTYLFTGSGSITGATTTVSVSGNLVMNNVNTYGGGTTLSGGGHTAILTGTALGSGPLTVGNATLNVSNATTLPNPVTINGNAIILVENTSTAALQLNGNLTGSSGSLTFGNDTGGTGANQPRVTLTATNIVFNLPIILDNFNYFPGTSQFSTNFFLAFNNSSGDQVFNGVISSLGIAQLQRRTGGGNTIFNAHNIYTNDTLLHLGGIGFGVDSIPTSGSPVVSGPISSGNLLLDGAGTMSVYAVGGARTIANPLFYITNTASILVFTGTNSLTFTGPMDLFGTTQTIEVDNTNAASVLAGAITNGVITGNGGGIMKTGVGPLTLSGVNSYTGPTTVSAGALLANGDTGPTTITVGSGGTLGGSGTVSGPVTVQSGGTIQGGADGSGTLTVNNTLSLAGNVAVSVNNSGTPTSGKIVVSGTLNNTGTGSVIVANVGPALTAGNQFQLFNKAVAGGDAMTITGGGATWVNHLAVDGSISVQSVGPAPSPVVTSVTLSGGNLIFGGTNGIEGHNYYVLTTTNLGLALSNWTAISTGAFGAGGVFSITNPVAIGTPARFYLLQVP